MRPYSPPIAAHIKTILDALAGRLGPLAPSRRDPVAYAAALEILG